MKWDYFYFYASQEREGIAGISTIIFFPVLCKSFIFYVLNVLFPCSGSGNFCAIAILHRRWRHVYHLWRQPGEQALANGKTT